MSCGLVGKKKKAEKGQKIDFRKSFMTVLYLVTSAHRLESYDFQRHMPIHVHMYAHTSFS